MATDLEQEVAEVRAMLMGISDTLHPTLSEFVRDEIERRQTLDLAAVVLAAALPEVDTDAQRQRRIQLAAALELLTVALDIHKFLMLGGVERDSIDRALAGGTVLAGDYCFSRAASLAAQTENPTVVAVFSDLLQQLSEGNLRRIFTEEDSTFDEATLLYASGARAGATLAELSPTLIDATAQFGASAHKRASSPNGYRHQESLQKALTEAKIAPFQRARWQEVVAIGRLSD